MMLRGATGDLHVRREKRHDFAFNSVTWLQAIVEILYNHNFHPETGIQLLEQTLDCVSRHTVSI